MSFREIFTILINKYMWALILGNEAHGISKKSIDSANTIINIEGKKTMESLNVAEVSNDEKLSRITIVTEGTSEVVSQIEKQLLRIVPVHSVSNLDEEGSAVEAEVALVNIDLNEGNKKKIYEVCDFYRARKIENENNSVIFEIAGASERINRFIKEMNQITKIEIVRSGPVAISTHKNTEEE